MGDAARQASTRQASYASTASFATESDRESLLDRAKDFWTSPSPAHAIIVAVLGSAAGGLAVPVEIPIIRSFACEWYYKRHPDQLLSVADNIFSYMVANEDRCQAPVIAKLAGEVITSARILNALISQYRYHQSQRYKD